MGGDIEFWSSVVRLTADLSGQVELARASDSTSPSGSHVIFKMRPVKVILLLLDYWLK